jgi:hypothetical protein
MQFGADVVQADAILGGIPGREITAGHRGGRFRTPGKANTCLGLTGTLIA